MQIIFYQEVLVTLHCEPTAMNINGLTLRGVKNESVSHLAFSDLLWPHVF